MNRHCFLLLFLVAATSISGCLRPAPLYDQGFNLDVLSDAQGYYRVSVYLDGSRGIAEDPLRPPGLGLHGFDCGRGHSPGYPSWMKVVIYESVGPDQTGTGAVVFVGNWTGLKCGGYYTFNLLDDDFNVEAYEVDEYRKMWPPQDKGQPVYKRGDDLTRVPP